MLENRITKFLKKHGVKYTEKDGTVIVKIKRTEKVHNGWSKPVKENLIFHEFDDEIMECKVTDVDKDTNKTAWVTYNSIIQMFHDSIIPSEPSDYVRYEVI